MRSLLLTPHVPRGQQAIPRRIWHAQSKLWVSGVYSLYSRIRSLDVGEERFFGDQEDFAHDRVAVLGSDVKKHLSLAECIWETIRIDGLSFQVIGVLKHAIQNNDDNQNGRSTSRSAA